MAEVKLKEEQELWEPAEEDNRRIKEDPDCGGVQRPHEAAPSLIQIKEEPEEVQIKQELIQMFPDIVSVESEKEESLLQETVKEENREDRDGAEAENSSDTDDSADWTPSAESPTPQTHTEQLQEPAHGNKLIMTKPKKPGNCPICYKRYKMLAKHIREFHQVVNVKERNILNDYARGRFLIPPGCCPIRSCFFKGQHVRKHVLNAHPEFDSIAKDKILVKASRKAAVAALRKLRASKPHPPLVSDLDLVEDSACKRPECVRNRELAEQCEDYRREIRRLRRLVQRLGGNPDAVVEEREEESQEKVHDTDDEMGMEEQAGDDEESDEASSSSSSLGPVTRSQGNRKMGNK